MKIWLLVLLIDGAGGDYMPLAQFRNEEQCQAVRQSFIYEARDKYEASKAIQCIPQ